MALQQAGLQWVNKNLQGFLGGIDSANRGMGGVGDSASGASGGLGILTGAVMGVASAITGALIGATTKGVSALIGLGTSSVDIATQFQSASSRLNIAAGQAAAETAQQFGGLSEIALQVGGDTRLIGVSATGAAAAMTDLFKAGIPLEDVLGDLNGYMDEGAELGGVLRASIDLAAATELDMVEASTLATVAMTQFGLEASTVPDVMDYFVRSADASVASVSDIRDGMINAGPTLRTMGFSVEETADQLALLTNAGLSGSMAGTALRSMWANMTKDSKKVTTALEEQGIALTDEYGNYKDLEEIIPQFEVAMESMTEAQRSDFAATVAGAYGKTALISLVNQGTEGYLDYTDAVENATGIEAQAAAAAATLAGQKEALAGNVETLKIRIGSALIPALTDMTGIFSELITEHGPKLTSFFEGVGEAASIFMEIVGAFLSGAPGDYPWEDIFPPGIADFIYEIADAFEMFPERLGSLPERLASVFPEVMGHLETMSDWWGEHGEDIKQKGGEIFDRLIAAGQDLTERIIPFINEQFAKLTAWWEENGDNVATVMIRIGEELARIGEAALSAWKFLEPLVSGMFDVALAIASVTMALLAGDWSGAFARISDVIDAGWTLIKETFVGFVDWVTGWFGSSFEGLKETWAQNWEMFKEIVSLVWEKMKTAIGEAIAGVGKAITKGWARIKKTSTNTVKKIVDGIIEKWDKLTKGVTTVWGKIKDGIATALASVAQKATTIWEKIKAAVVTVVESIVSGITERWNNLVNVVTTIWTAVKEAVISVVGAIVTGITERWDNLVSLVTGIWERLKTGVIIIVGTLLAYLTGQTELGNQMVAQIWENMKANAMAIFTAIATTISEIWTKIKTTAITIWESITTWLTTAWANIGVVATAAWEALKATAATLWEGLKAGITGIIDALKTWLSTTWENIKTTITTTWENLKTTAATIWENMKTAITTTIETLSTWIPTTWETIKTTIETTWENLKTAAETTWEDMKTAITTVIEDLQTWLPETWDAIKATAEEKWEEFKTGISTKVEETVAKVEEYIENMKTWLSEIDLKQIGKDIIQGLIDGVSAMADALRSKISSVVQGAIDAALDALGMGSPSKVFLDMGQMTGQGFIDGMLKSRYRMANAVSQAVNYAISSGQGTLDGSTLSMTGAARMAGGMAYASSNMMQVDRSRTINVEMSPTYLGERSIEESALDIRAALGAAYL